MAAAAPKKKPKPLTNKQKEFVTEYLLDKNGAAAAERAGYSAKCSKQTAHDLLQDERIMAAIDKVLDEKAMRASEAIGLLADWGRGTVKRFLKVQEDGKMVINLAHAEAQENLHLLKKVKQKRRITRTEHGEFEDITTEIELYDAKDAVHKILQLHGRYAPQKVDHTTLGQALPAPQSNIFVPDNGR
ncbi:terminase small subunit [Hymenobacter sp. RP-2-7]|uniref:Terminase small subunit n=1 Tax=Hymenobacter polaris TaxID=2682546 RepID=A0A7Y0FP44_9BACT|nr:terminase small subunit [Hymenobacter polaris]NML67618.1 terminase small subunit [Hymenobacter polaris]